MKSAILFAALALAAPLSAAKHPTPTPVPVFGVGFQNGKATDFVSVSVNGGPASVCHYAPWQALCTYPVNAGSSVTVTGDNGGGTQIYFTVFGSTTGCTTNNPCTLTMPPYDIHVGMYYP